MRIAIANPLLAILLPILLTFEPFAVPVYAQDQPAPTKLNITILEGEGALNNVRQRVSREPIVQVEDENRKPVAGAAVTFLLPNQGAGATFADGARSLTVVTDNKGQAIARGLRPNNVNGQYQIRVNASFRGQTASTTINQTNALVASAAVSGKLILLLAIAGGAVAGGVYAATRGGGGNNNPATNTGTTLAPGTPTVGAPR